MQTATARKSARPQGRYVKPRDRFDISLVDAQERELACKSVSIYEAPRRWAKYLYRHLPDECRAHVACANVWKHSESTGEYALVYVLDSTELAEGMAL